jgi:hypothetical protein
MAGFSLLDDEELNVDISNGDILEVIPEENLDAHAPDEALETDVEDIGEIAEGLEACHDMLAMAAAARAMNPQAAQFAGLAIQLAERNIRGNFSVGLNKALDGKGKYGLEAFEDKASGTAYASYAMLGIMDTLKSIWTRIVEFLTKWFDKVATWFNKYLSGAAFAKRKAEAIKKKADKELGSLKSEDFTINQTESMNLSIDGKFDPKLALKDTLESLTELDCEKIVDRCKTSLKEMKELVAAGKVHGKRPRVTNGITLQGVVEGTMGEAGAHLTIDDSRFKSSDTSKHYLLTNIAGGNMIVMSFNGKEVGGIVVFRGMSTTIVKFDVKAKGDKKVSALNTGGVSTLAEQCSSAASELIKFKDLFREGKRELAAFKSEIDDLIKEIGELDSAKMDTEVKSATNAYIGGMASTISAPYTAAKALQSQTLTTINAALNYCLKSLSHHKKD